MVDPPVVLSTDWSPPTPVDVVGGVVVVFGVARGGVVVGFGAARLVFGPSRASGNDRRLFSLSGPSPLANAASVRIRI